MLSDGPWSGAVRRSRGRANRRTRVGRAAAPPSGESQRVDGVHGIARGEGLSFVHVGNVPGHPGNNTVCPGCGKVVIRRVDMAVVKMDLKAGACARAGDTGDLELAGLAPPGPLDPPSR